MHEPEWRPLHREPPVDHEPVELVAPLPLGWSLPRAVPLVPRAARELLKVEVPDTVKPLDEAPEEPDEPDPLLGAVEDWYRDSREGRLRTSVAELQATIERERLLRRDAEERLAQADRLVEQQVAIRVAEEIGRYQQESLEELQDAVKRARTKERNALLGTARAAEAAQRDLGAQVRHLQEANRVLEQRVAELSAPHDALERERRARELTEAAWARQLSDAENRARRLQAELDAMRSQPHEVDLGPVEGPLDAIRTIPTSLREEVDLFAMLQDRVEFLPSALLSADKYHGPDLDRYWAGLLAMHDHLWPLKFLEEDVQISRDFKERSGFEYAANESPETLAIEECRRARTFRYNGEDVLMTNHVKIGNPSRYADGALRVYFLFDAERRKLVVGHIGKHLPTKGWLRST